MVVCFIHWSCQWFHYVIWPQCPQPRWDATGAFRASCFWAEDSGESWQVIGPVDSFQGFWRHEVQVERWALESHLQGTSKAADWERQCKNAVAGLPHTTLPHIRSRNYTSLIPTTGQILDSSYWWSLGTDAQFGKLSDGDNIDLMIIIWQTNVFVVNSSLFLFNYLLYEILVQLLIGLLENRLARVALSSSMYYIAFSRY